MSIFDQGQNYSKPMTMTAEARSVRIESEIARRGIKLSAGSVERYGPCPVCGGTDRFSINLKKQLWNCRKCEVGGDVIALVRHLDGVNFKEAVEKLAGRPAAKRLEAKPARTKRNVVARFDYHDAHGAVAYQVERVEYQNPDCSYVLGKDGKRKKDFPLRRPDPDRPREWIYNLGDTRLILYRLPELIEALAYGRTVVLVEGEAKADLLWSWYIPATCSPMGAKNWRGDLYAATLRGADIVVLPDNDPDGMVYLDAVAVSLTEVGASVRVLDLPVGPKGDVIDWERAGGTVEQLHALIDNDARPWVPGEREPEEVSAPGARKQRKKHPAVPSEDALALDFAGRHGNELRFVSFWGKWLKWTAGRWQVEKTLAAYDLARKICHGHSLGGLRARTVAAIELMARSDRRLAATTDQWDADPWLFNTPAGTVELITGNLREHRPQDYVMRIAGCSPGREGCPMFFEFLNTIFAKDQDLINYLQKFFGYILTGLTSEHAMLFFHGAGANGKSVLVSTIAGILGEYHRVAPIDTFTATGFSRHSTDLAGLMGAQLVTAHETEEGAKWAEAKLKALTGGDKITAQFMRQDYFDYVPAFKLAITGNHKPGLQSVDEAMRRRLNLIPFNVTIPKADRDPYLVEKLKTEWPGILAWMITGCLLWQEEGALHPPQAVVAATDEYLESEDAMAMWISERCELKASFEDTAEELFKSWKAWAELMREPAGSAKAFSNKLQARAGIKRKEIGHSNVRGYSGIRVVNIELAQSEQSSFYRDD